MNKYLLANQGASSSERYDLSLQFLLFDLPYLNRLELCKNRLCVVAFTPDCRPSITQMIQICRSYGSFLRLVKETRQTAGALYVKKGHTNRRNITFYDAVFLASCLLTVRSSSTTLLLLYKGAQLPCENVE